MGKSDLKTDIDNSGEDSDSVMKLAVFQLLLCTFFEMGVRNFDPKCDGWKAVRRVLRIWEKIIESKCDKPNRTRQYRLFDRSCEIPKGQQNLNTWRSNACQLLKTMRRNLPTLEWTEPEHQPEPPSIAAPPVWIVRAFEDIHLRRYEMRFEKMLSIWLKFHYDRAFKC